MPFDTATIARAMRAAGLDPNRQDHLVRFRDALLAELADLPQRAIDRFRESGDASEVLASTADRVVFEDQDQRVQQFNLHNDPTELFKLTDLSRQRVTTEQVRGRQVSKPAALQQGDNFTPDRQPPARPSQGTLDDLWNQAREQGKI